MAEKFYQKSRLARIQQLLDEHIITEFDAVKLIQNQPIDDLVANQMIENQIGQFNTPFGVALNFEINQENFVIPMVTEEPSVIAAASHGAKMIKQSGGFTATAKDHLMTGEVVFDQVKDIEQTYQVIQAHMPEIKSAADRAHPSLIERGGGLQQIKLQVIENRFLKLELTIDTKDAMGANLVNTISEAVAKRLGEWVDGTLILAILSNEAEQATATATVELDPVVLATKSISDGTEIANKIVAATEFAKLDRQRAITHNKGIMNGVQAVTLATGNDTRAMSAGAGAFAAQNGYYQPLSDWQINEHGKLVGTLTLPMPIGVVGGTIKQLPMAQLSLSILRQPNVQQLAQIIASVGLAQNLAALHALVTDGIQRGHMALQARNLALSAGAKTEAEIKNVSESLKNSPVIDLKTAQQALQAMHEEENHNDKNRD